MISVDRKFSTEFKYCILEAQKMSPKLVKVPKSLHLHEKYFIISTFNSVLTFKISETYLKMVSVDSKFCADYECILEESKKEF